MIVDWRRCLPLLMVALFGAVFAAWNSAVGMSWQGPGTVTIVAMTSPLLLIALYTRGRGERVISEICLFLFLFFVFPMLGVKLSYLATTLNRPLADDYLAWLDSTLGFSWTGWAAFNDSHAALKWVISLAYASPIAQAVGSVVIFAVFANGRRNYETLFALLLALTMVLVIYAAYPALGPQSHMGVPTSYARMIMGIRGGHVSNLIYTGIVWFPSYHTVMAIIFTYGHRGLKYSFPPVLTLNGLMLLAIPNIGLHYLTDMIGGAALALVSIAAARHVYQPKPLVDAVFEREAVAVA